MKKQRSLLLFLTCLLVLTVNAGRINEQQALEKARQFMQANVLNTAHLPRCVRRAQASLELHNLYIFNVEDHDGFVIVSADDRTDAVLGYSTTGRFDAEHIPDNFRSWLQQIEAEIESLPTSYLSGGDNQEISSRSTVTHAKIDPLITTTWNQGNRFNSSNSDGVYNIHLPKIGSQYPCAGCVAVAGAQLMYYYRWPQDMTQSVPGYDPPYLQSEADTQSDLSPISFQWDKMKTSYVVDDRDTEAVNAVADLLLYTAYAAKMYFGVDGSSASLYQLANGLCDYFDYHPTSWKFVFRSDYSVSEWDALIYNELASGRPVAYCGDSNANGIGHAFICDGYDGAGMYHFNWGWGGLNDGYFKLYATNPYGMKNGGFILNHACLIGLQPSNWPGIEGSTVDGERESPDINDVVLTAIDVNTEETKITMSLRNDYEGAYRFGYGMGELNSDGSVTPLEQHESNYSNDLMMGTYFTNVSFNVSSYNLSDGLHILVPICQVNDVTAWKCCRPSDLYFEVNVADGNYTITVYPQANLRVTQFNYAGNLTVGEIQQVDVEIENLADAYIMPLYLFASTTNTKRLVYTTGSAIERNGSDEVTFYFQPRQAGNWNLWVTTDSKGINVIGKTKVWISDVNEQDLPTNVKTVQDKANARQFIAKYVHNSVCPVYIDAADAKVFSIYVDGNVAYYQACRTKNGKYYINKGNHVIIRTDSEKEVEIHADKMYTGTGSIGFDDIYDSKEGDDLASVKAALGITDGLYLYRLTNTEGLGFGFTLFTGTTIKPGQFFIACSKKPEGDGH